jgi:hypothetical protein
MGLKELTENLPNDFEDGSSEPDGYEVLQSAVEPPEPQLGEPNYVHSIFYDAARFPTESHQHAVLETVRNRFPDLDWVMSPSTVPRLHMDMPLFAESHARQFENDGFVAELERPRPKSGPRQRLQRGQQAWDAFLANVVIADAIAYVCRKRPAVRRGNVIFPRPMNSAFIPMLGKSTKADKAIGTSILVADGEFLTAARTFSRNGIGYPAQPVTYNSALKDGRAAFGAWTSDTRRAVRRRVELELQAWADHLGDQFSADGLILWAAQTLGLLRIQATEWKFRERVDYVLSGAPAFLRNGLAHATRQEYSDDQMQEMTAEIEATLNAAQFAPALRRPADSALSDVVSILAGGIGLSDEQVDTDQSVARAHSARHGLGAVAEWVGRLRRFHHAMLTPDLAALLREAVTGEAFDLRELEWSGDDWSGPDLIRSQFPDATWMELLGYAEDCFEESESIEVRYAWNANPVDPPTVTRDGRVVIVTGPFLAIDLRVTGQWARKAERFRERRALTS